MEQKDFDIYEILKDVPDDTPLYSPLCGNVEFNSVAEDKDKAELKTLVEVLESDEIQKYIKDTYDGAVVPIK